MVIVFVPYVRKTCVSVEIQTSTGLLYNIQMYVIQNIHVLAAKNCLEYETSAALDTMMQNMTVAKEIHL